MQRRLINELQNSDLFAFLFVYYFFGLFVRKKKKMYLAHNKFLQSNIVMYSNKLFKKYIRYIFFKLSFCSVRKSPNRLFFKFLKKRRLLKRLKRIESKKRRSLILSFYKDKLDWLRYVNVIKRRNKHRIRKGLKLLKIKSFKSKFNQQEYDFLNYFREVQKNKIN